MGGCKSKSQNKLNENSNVQRKLRIGIGLKKGEDGDFHFGLEGGFEKKKNKHFTVIEKKKEETNIKEEETNIKEEETNIKEEKTNIKEEETNIKEEKTINSK